MPIKFFLWDFKWRETIVVSPIRSAFESSFSAMALSLTSLRFIFPSKTFAREWGYSGKPSTTSSGDSKLMATISISCLLQVVNFPRYRSSSRSSSLIPRLCSSGLPSRYWNVSPSSRKSGVWIFLAISFASSTRTMPSPTRGRKQSIGPPYKWSLS